MPEGIVIAKMRPSGKRQFLVYCELCGKTIVKRDVPGRFFPAKLHIYVIAWMMTRQSHSDNPVAKMFHGSVLCLKCHERADYASKLLGFTCDHKDH